MIQTIENILLPLVSKVNECLSNYILVFLLLGVGIFYTLKTRFVQIRCFGDGIKNIFSRSDNSNDNEMTPFQAFSAAVAAQVGTGSIVGAAGAILVGGPGAIFWMWVISFFGMATIYAEATLALKTRIKDENGNIFGGPVYYIRTAFKGKFGKFLAGFFAVAIILALGFMGCMVQSNAISLCMHTAFHVPASFVGFLLVLICGFVFSGGVKRLAVTVEKLVPVMSVFFIIGGLIILFVRREYLIQSFYMIFKYAFCPQAILGGTFFYAISQALSQGAKRGLFSNEAGLGSTPHAHALANVKNPHIQGTIAMLGVFFDIFIILTLNALVIISTMYTPDGALANGYTEPLKDVLTKTNLVQTSFSQIFGYPIGTGFVAVCVFFFAFSTILSWNMFGKINALYLSGNNKYTKYAYIVVALYFIMIGSLVSSDFVWELTDMFNNLMVIPNVIALFALSKTVISVLQNKDKAE